jgi:hypothetical protein
MFEGGSSKVMLILINAAMYSVNNTDLPSLSIKDYIRIHSYG